MCNFQKSGCLGLLLVHWETIGLFGEKHFFDKISWYNQCISEFQVAFTNGKVGILDDK